LTNWCWEFCHTTKSSSEKEGGSSWRHFGGEEEEGDLKKELILDCIGSSLYFSFGLSELGSLSVFWLFHLAIFWRQRQCFFNFEWWVSLLRIFHFQKMYPPALNLTFSRSRERELTAKWKDAGNLLFIHS